MSNRTAITPALLALLAASSTCPRAQAQEIQQSGESLAAQSDEWRLDGAIVRLDARGSAFWLRADVLVMRDQSADLDAASRARRISVDAATLVWTPDGQMRPFGFNALSEAVRLEREVSVVGTRESTSQGPILRARLLILPDLLPALWKPQPFGAALAARASAKRKPAATTARASPARTATARTATARTPASRSSTAQLAASATASGRIAASQASTAPASTARSTARTAAPLATAPATTARTSTALTSAALTAASQTPAARTSPAREAARPQIAPQIAPTQLPQFASRRAVAKPSVAIARVPSAASAGAPAAAPRQEARGSSERARLATDFEPKAPSVRAQPFALARRAPGRPPAFSEPTGASAAGAASGGIERSALSAREPQLATRASASSALAQSQPSSRPSSPRVGVAREARDGQVSAQADAAVRGEGSERAGVALAARAQEMPRDVQPRDAGPLIRQARRERLREQLRAAAPSTSAQGADSSWSESAPSAAPPRRGEGRAEPLLDMRDTPLSLPQRRVERPPLLSSQPFGSDSRLAVPAAPQASQVQVPPVATPRGRALDAVRAVASGEQSAALARSRFADLRAMQDDVAWSDFCGGPGWDGALIRASTAGISSTSEAAGPHAGPKLVALTFDDGPHPNTRRVLDILDAHGARATFFVVGRNVEKHGAVLSEIARRGHDVGNHSFQHFQGVRLSLGDWQSEIDRTNSAISQVLGSAPRWFRAPGCRYSDEALLALGRRKMVRVDSSNNSGDWHEPSASKIAARVLSRLAPGQVILFHDPLPQTALALPALLREMQARGYRCVTLSELARAARENQAFVPPVCPPGQGIILPPSALAGRRGPQVLAGSPGSGAALPADAPVLLQVQP